MGAQHIVMGVSEVVAATGASVQCRMHYQAAASCPGDPWWLLVCFGYMSSDPDDQNRDVSRLC
jgi:hypothetical protein